MEIRADKLYAVITGDVVRSSRFVGVHRKKLHDAMTAADNALRQAFKDDVKLPVDIFRGDSWQCLVQDPINSVRVGLFYRAALKASMDDNETDSRLAVAVGEVDFVPEERVSGGDGDAYRLSGQLIETMGHNVRMNFGFAGKEDIPEIKAVAVTLGLMDALARQWTSRQATAVCGALRNLPQKEIAETLWPRPITQQAVAQHLDRAGWHAIHQGLRFIEETLKQFLET
jgi:hypothetical protein